MTLHIGQLRHMLVMTAPVRLLSQDVRHVPKDNINQFRPWIPGTGSFDGHEINLVGNGQTWFEAACLH